MPKIDLKTAPSKYIAYRVGVHHFTFHRTLRWVLLDAVATGFLGALLIGLNTPVAERTVAGIASNPLAWLGLAAAWVIGHLLSRYEIRSCREVFDEIPYDYSLGTFTRQCTWAHVFTFIVCALNTLGIFVVRQVALPDYLQWLRYFPGLEYYLSMIPTAVIGLLIYGWFTLQINKEIIGDEAHVHGERA